MPEPTPLSLHLRDGGAEVGALDDVEVAGGASGRAAAQAEAALFDLGWHDHIVVTGRHRGRFVHNMTTCAIKTLGPGEGRFGLVVNDGGKVVASFTVDAEAEQLVMEVPRTLVEGMLAQLRRYIIADDVRFAVDAERHVLGLVGPGAGAVLESVTDGALPTEAFGWVDTTVAGVAARVRRNDGRLALPGWDVTVASADASTVWGALQGAGGVAGGLGAFETLRVEAGVPRVGVDMGDENIPLESERLAETIDWDKGCYIGQEVIAMMHYRGRPNRHLRGLRLPDAGALPAPGTALVSDTGKTLATVGTSLHSPAAGAPIALAVIKRKHAAPGTQLALPGGGEAEVLALPIAAAEAG